MKTEKKCPNCGAWTQWDKRQTDRCNSCNELLDAISFTEKNEREEIQQASKEKDFFRIRETDALGMKIVRKTALVLHVIFAAITWAFLWMATTFAG